jgi:hypothetical protein
MELRDNYSTNNLPRRGCRFVKRTQMMGNGAVGAVPKGLPLQGNMNLSMLISTKR